MSDRALLVAVSAWGGSDTERVWERFSSPWRERLQAAPVYRVGSQGARGTLLRLHTAMARPDPNRVHGSWFARALQEERPSVRLAVVAHADEPMARELRSGLRLTEADLAPDHPPHPLAVRWAQSLWTERLVGGPPPSPGDEPVVALFTRLEGQDARDRFAGLLALAKWGYALAAPGLPPDFESRHPLDPDEAARLEHFRAAWGEADPRLAHMAHLDLSSCEAQTPFLPRLGLVTIARLLSAVEPSRVRWLLQHIPYDAAKLARARMNLSNPFVPRRVLLDWERRIFRAAEERLRAEHLQPGSFG